MKSGSFFHAIALWPEIIPRENFCRMATDFFGDGPPDPLRYGDAVDFVRNAHLSDSYLLGNVFLGNIPNLKLILNLGRVHVLSSYYRIASIAIRCCSLRSLA